MSKYRIQAVAQLTGLSPAVIRAWEARYGLVVPQRTEGGYRVYSDEDVRLLRGAQRLTAEGMAPKQVAALGRAELLRGADDAGAAAGAALLPGPHLSQIVAAFAAFDRARAEQLLAPALATLPPATACEQVLGPLLREIADGGHRGGVSPAAERFGAALVRGKLMALLEVLCPRSSTRRLVCACPPGQWQELDLLLLAVPAAAQGWEVIYLGAGLPLEGLAEAARRTGAQLVALSLAESVDAPQLLRLVADARRLLPGQTPLLAVGRGLAGHEDAARRAGAALLPASGRLDDLL